jgi:DNA mismatch repair protein MutS2
LNAATLKILEFDTIISLVASHAGSILGKDRVQRLSPHVEVTAVRRALRGTTEGAALLRTVGRQPYHDLPDLGETLAAARVGGLHLEPAALLDLASFIEGGLEIARRVARDGGAPMLAGLASQVRDTTPVATAIRRAILSTGEVADDASPKLAETRRSILRLRAQLQSVMDSYLHARDADRLLQEKLVTTRNDRYVLLVKAEQRSALPGVVHGSSGSGASVFVEPLPAVELNNDIVALADEERRELVRILRELTARVGAVAGEIERAAEVLAELDAVQAMALTARDMGANAPEIVDWQRAAEAGAARRAQDSTPLLELSDARHPLLMPAIRERLGMPRRSTREPVPVTIRLEAGEPVLVISGPNTGGKTVALKTVGLLALMAQSGLHLPVAPGSVLPVFRRIFADIGDEQSIAADLSTFSAHLAAIVEMARDLAPPALVLLDEVGAGTDPTEGGALGVAIVDHFRARGAVVVTTTHHGVMKAYAQATPGVVCGSFGYDPESYLPTYHLTLGQPGRSLALEMAERLGLPSAVVADARARRDQREAQAEALLQKLEQDQAALRRAQEQLAEERRDLDAERQALAAAERELAARKRNELEAFRRELLRRGEEAARRAADAIREAVARVEAARRSVGTAGDKARAEAMRTLRAAQAEAIADLGVPVSDPASEARPVRVGDRVRVVELGLVGEVLALAERDEAEVAVSDKRLRVPRASLVPVAGAAPRGANPVAPAAVKARAGVPGEINLVGLTVDEALPRVDKLLDDAALAERQRIRVIHGFGQGKLRRAVEGLLSGHPHVASYRLGQGGEGGGGVTIVELKE